MYWERERERERERASISYTCYFTNSDAFVNTYNIRHIPNLIWGYSLKTFHYVLFSNVLNECDDT